MVILRPSDVYGPNDRTTSLRLLSGIEDGWPVIAGTGRHVLSFCFVGNLAQACHLACQMRGRNGAAYTVTNGQDVTWRQLMGFFQDRLGRKQRLFVPMAAAYVIAVMMQLLHAVFPAFVMRVSFYPVSKVGRDTSYDISRTRNELGYEPEQDLEAAAGVRGPVVPGREGVGIHQADRTAEVGMAWLSSVLGAVSDIASDPYAVLFCCIGVAFLFLSSVLNVHTLLRRSAHDYPAVMTYFASFFFLMFVIPMALVLIEGPRVGMYPWTLGLRLGNWPKGLAIVGVGAPVLAVGHAAGPAGPGAAPAVPLLEGSTGAARDAS